MHEVDDGNFHYKCIGYEGLEHWMEEYSEDASHHEGDENEKRNM